MPNRQSRDLPVRQVVRRLLRKNRGHRAVLQCLRCDAHGSTHFPPVPPNSWMPTARSHRRWCSNSRKARCAPMGPIEHESLGALAEPEPVLPDKRDGPAHRAARARQSRLPLHQGAGEPPARIVPAPPRADIHPADLSDPGRTLRHRSGSPRKIESEGSVVDLLDYDVSLRPGLPVRAATAGAGRGAQGIAVVRTMVARNTGKPGDGGSRRAHRRDECRRPLPDLRAAPPATRDVPEARRHDRTTGLAQLGPRRRQPQLTAGGRDEGQRDR